MYCKNCGAMLEEDANFCTYCGTASNINNVRCEENRRLYELTSEQIYAQAEFSMSTLVWGIFGLILSALFFTSPIGLIISAVGKHKADKYIYKYNEYPPRVRLGRKMSLVGFILGIVFTACLLYWAIMAIIIYSI